MGSRRRRHHHHGRWVVPSVAPAAAAFAAAGLLLVVVAFHCFLSPPLGDGGMRAIRRTNPPFLLNKPAELRRDVVGTVDFTVPSGGSRLGEELWESKAARNFFACSNATKRFADSNAVTKSDRYLMIATSGGLNQQRTGFYASGVYQLLIYSNHSLIRSDIRGPDRSQQTQFTVPL